MLSLYCLDINLETLASSMIAVIQIHVHRKDEEGKFHTYTL